MAVNNVIALISLKHKTARNCEICGEAFVLGDYSDTRRICPSCVEGLKELLKERKEDT